jgi:hypothetical protein
MPRPYRADRRGPSGTGVGVGSATDERGATVPEKSPQKPAAKKTGKTLKEKRVAKQEKKDSKPRPS